MLELIVSNDVAYIWTVEDWYKVRTEYKIIGCFDGAQGEWESGPNHKNLPLKLSKVETQFLIKHGLAKTIEAPKLKNLRAPVSEETFQNLRKKRIEIQLKEFKEKRRSEIESMVDKIIDGKRKKGKSVIPDRNAVIQDQLHKIKSLPYEMIQIDLVDVWTSVEDYIPLEFPIPTSPLDILRLRVFEDFHSNHKYFLTSGEKFGGDFLAYPGDPIKYHSQFIIICQQKGRQLPDIYLISQKRLAATVKKILLIATLDENSNSLKYKHI